VLAAPERGAARPRALPPWIILVAALVVTVAAAWVIAENARVRDRVRFERAAQSARERVAARIDVYVALLRGAAGLVAVEPRLSRADFEAYARRLDVRGHYPGIQGVGLSLRVPASEVPALEARMRAEGVSEFRVRPESPRDEYHVITFLAPLDRRNRVALGFDMFTEPVRREAMARARDAAEPALSGRVTLVQEIDARRQAGFLIYVPIYRGGVVPETVAARRDSLAGFVYAPFRADDLFAGIFGSRQAPEVELRIYDGRVAAPDRLLHDSHALGGRPFQPPAELVDTLGLEVAGRRWTMVVTPTAAFAGGLRASSAPAVFALGLLVSLALYGIARTRQRAGEAVAEARDLLGRVLEQAPVAICVLRGPDHVFEVANPFYRRLLAADDPIGRPLRDVVPEAEEQGFVAALDRVYASGTPWVGHAVELSYDRAGRGVREPAYFNVLYYPFEDEDGATTGVIAVAAEVTAEVLARHDAELARHEAERANQAKSEFLAAMSHELRTPLNAIGGHVQLIEMGIHGPVTDAQREALARVQRSGSHLLSLINDVLNFAKLEAGRVEYEICDVPLADVAADVVPMVEPQFAAKGLTCRTDVRADALAHADPEKVRQILLNLLSNAVKFTEHGGVTVDAPECPDADGMVSLRVADTGVGIPRDKQAAIFDPFVQVHRRLSNSTEGTGLGLAISRDLARGMGGELTVESAPGEGSRFTLTLPRGGAARD
jgi:signal transduction histidine kinase/CHASE1-domain containing sensor protein